MIAALLLFAAQLETAERPAFDIPTRFRCTGKNFKGQAVDLMVRIDGNSDRATLIVSPVQGTAWPQKKTSFGPLTASFFRSPDTALWYWVSTPFSDGNSYSLGFDVKLSGVASLRFGRPNFQKFTEHDFHPDPLGSQHIDCLAQA